MLSDKSPHLYIIAGPNGSGKTTHLYRPLLDTWMLFDNSADLPRLIADEEYGDLTITDDRLFSRIERSSK